jgi:ribosomal subunit interface protein
MLALPCGAEWNCFATPPDSAFNPTGAIMNVSISYKHVEEQQPVAVEVMRRLDKLNRLLKSYQPDMIQLKGVFSKNQRTEEQSCALTLSLPNGTLHATGNGKNVLAGCKKAFSEIETQVKKHQSRLRREHEWKRKRPIE